MATCCCRKREGVPATAPRFFKIIVNPESDTLIIPTEFTRRHGPVLRNRLFLKVPEGSTMEVELIQSSSNDEAWLQKGWLEFKERYSIGFGYLLVFSYNGNSQFDVLIFDPTGTEITYPVEGTQPKSKSDNDDDNSVVILENREVSRNPLAKTKRKCSHNNMVEFPSSKSIPDRSVKLEESSTSSYLRKTKTVANETCIAYQKALAYKSNTCQQKPHFISVMQPSYVSDTFILNVPFVKTYSPLSIGNNKLHLTMNGRKWDVKCWVYRGFHKAYLGSGWKKLYRTMGLK